MDGVLNCDTTEESINGWCFVDNEKIRLVRYIIDHTGAKVVLDSTWRQGYYGITQKAPGDVSDWGEMEYQALEERCAQFGVRFFGYTGWPEISDRGKEIDDWMRAYDRDFGKADPITSFVIIDDWDLEISEKFPENFVKTSERHGITFSDAEKAIAILGENDK